MLLAVLVATVVAVCVFVSAARRLQFRKVTQAQVNPAPAQLPHYVPMYICSVTQLLRPLAYWACIPAQSFWVSHRTIQFEPETNAASTWPNENR